MTAKIINIALTAFLAGGILMGTFFNDVQFTECGMCGAHITEWWKVRDNADTCFVDVCSFCYDSIYNAE